LFAAQPLNCSPVEVSFAAGVDTPVARETHPTLAEGTAIKAPLRLKQMIAALRETGGGAAAIAEADIVAALRRLAGQGLFVEPTSATAAAALDQLAAAGAIGARETTVVVLSGSGLKAAATMAGLFAEG
jgi:threonine synthase